MKQLFLNLMSILCYHCVSLADLNMLLLFLGASGLHLTKHENFHGGLDAISVGDGLFTILTTLSKKATTVQVMLQPILTYMACGYMGRQVSFQNITV